MADNSLITMVFPANVAKIWPQVSELLKPEVDRGGTHDIDDVRREIVSGKCQLWVQWNGSCEAALVSEFQNFPKGVFLHIWLFVAAPDKKPDEEMFEKHLFDFAVANGCAGIKHEGRKGWERKHKHLPLSCENIMYYFLLKDLKEAS